MASKLQGESWVRCANFLLDIVSVRVELLIILQRILNSSAQQVLSLCIGQLPTNYRSPGSRERTRARTYDPYNILFVVEQPTSSWMISPHHCRQCLMMKSTALCVREEGPSIFMSICRTLRPTQS